MQVRKIMFTVRNHLRKKKNDKDDLVEFESEKNSVARFTHFSTLRSTIFSQNCRSHSKICSLVDPEFAKNVPDPPFPPGF
jgi:hypothetical protein